MDDLSLDMLKLSSKGYCCSQMLLIFALELQGESNPALVRSMSGLGHGLGQCGEVCGALTGGACLIALYAGKGSDEETEHERFQLMVSELVDWFRGTACADYPGITCADILDGPGGRPDQARCGALVQGVYTRVMEILQENGIDPTLPKEAVDAF